MDKANLLWSDYRRRRHRGDQVGGLAMRWSRGWTLTSDLMFNRQVLSPTELHETSKNNSLTGWTIRLRYGKYKRGIRGGPEEALENGEGMVRYLGVYVMGGPVRA